MSSHVEEVEQVNIYIRDDDIVVQRRQCFTEGCERGVKDGVDLPHIGGANCQQRAIIWPDDNNIVIQSSAEYPNRLVDFIKRPLKDSW